MSDKEPVSITIEGETKVVVPPVECEFCGDDGYAVIGDDVVGKPQISIVCKDKYKEVNPEKHDKKVVFL